MKFAVLAKSGSAVSYECDGSALADGGNYFPLVRGKVSNPIQLPENEVSVEENSLSLLDGSGIPFTNETKTIGTILKPETDVVHFNHYHLMTREDQDHL